MYFHVLYFHVFLSMKYISDDDKGVRNEMSPVSVVSNYQRSELVCLMCWKLHSVWPPTAKDIKIFAIFKMDWICSNLLRVQVLDFGFKGNIFIRWKKFCKRRNKSNPDLEVGGLSTLNGKVGCYFKHSLPCCIPGEWYHVIIIKIYGIPIFTPLFW